MSEGEATAGSLYIVGKLKSTTGRLFPEIKSKGVAIGDEPHRQ